jgi:hypothetical protein
MTNSQSREKTMKKLTLSTMLSLLLITTCKQRAGAALSSQQTSFCFGTKDPNSIFDSHDNRITVENKTEGKNLKQLLEKKCGPLLQWPTAGEDDCPDILPGFDSSEESCLQSGFFGLTHDAGFTVTHEAREIDFSKAQTCVQNVLNNFNCGGMPPTSYTVLEGILVYGATALIIFYCCIYCTHPARKYNSNQSNMESDKGYRTCDDDNDDNESILNPEEQEEHKHPQDLEEGLAAHQPRQ